MGKPAPWLKLARLIAKHDPSTADRACYCFACGDSFSIPSDLDPSALCNMCAQKWVQTFATILSNLHRKKR